MDGKVASGDRLVAAIAARQHGAVSIDQLRAAQLSEDSVRRRVQSGKLHRVHRGVYAVGYPRLSQEGMWMAAVLACGRRSAVGHERDLDRGTGNGGLGCGSAGQSATREGRTSVLEFWGAALSDRAAAALWDLLPPHEGPIDVSVPGPGGKARRRGIRLHRRPALSAADVTLRKGIPVTTPSRTIADLRRAAAGCPGSGKPTRREVRRAIRQSEIQGLPLGPEAGGDRTRSDLERAFLLLCRRYRLPTPEVNVRVGRHLVDFLWRERRLIVETDGYRYHRGRTAFDEDRTRDLELRGHGYQVIRLSSRMVAEEPQRLAAALAAELGVGDAAEKR